MSKISAAVPATVEPLRGKPLLFARLGWIAITLVTIGLDLFAIPTLYGEALTPCPYSDATLCADVQFTASQLAQLSMHGISAAMFATFNVVLETAAMLIFAVVAAVIFWRRSADRMALFAAYMLVTFGGAAFNGAMQALSDVNHAWFVPVMTLNIIGQISFAIFFFVFPDGRFVPRWTRWVTVLWLLAWLTRYFPGSALQGIANTIVNGPLFVVLLLVLVLSQVYRYRRVSNARQRQQTKWVVYGFALGLSIFASLIVIGNFVLVDAAESNAIGVLLFNASSYVLLTLIPISIGIAVLRSQLYDIDVIIRRTLIYGLLSAILAALYFSGVVGTQTLVGSISDKAAEQQPLIIVATTLLIAALFQPLRHRLQSFIDRRFYRRKYDAERTLTTFAATLREQVDLPELRDHLLATVDETMQPLHLSVWFQTQRGDRGEDRS